MYINVARFLRTEVNEVLVLLVMAYKVSNHINFDQYADFHMLESWSEIIIYRKLHFIIKLARAKI